MVASSSLQQKALGFLKPEVNDRTIELMTLIKSNDAWKVTYEKELNLNLAQAELLYDKSTQDASWIIRGTIHAFILEGTNVIENWLNFVGPSDPAEAKKNSPQSLRAIYGLDLVRNVCHASRSEKEAQHDLVWLETLATGTLSTLSKTTITSTQKSILNKPSRHKTLIGRTALKTTIPNPAALTTKKHPSMLTSPATRSETRKVTPLAKNNMTNSHPKSSLGPRPSNQSFLNASSKPKITNTGLKSKPLSLSNCVTMTPEPRNNKDSSSNGRASKTKADTLDQRKSGLEKRKGAAVPISPLIPDDSQKAQQLMDKKYIKMGPRNEDTLIRSAMPSIDDILITTDGSNAQIPQATESIDTLSSTSTLSSQNTRNSDYDAEVTATIKCTTIPDLIDSSTSPAISKSPEVGSLRQRFEYLAQTRSATTSSPQSATISIKRTSSFTPEIAYRIKDLKPKDPAGSRVKSMVSFFMDENLHKWEF